MTNITCARVRTRVKGFGFVFFAGRTLDTSPRAIQQQAPSAPAAPAAGGAAPAPAAVLSGGSTEAAAPISCSRLLAGSLLKPHPCFPWTEQTCTHLSCICAVIVLSCLSIVYTVYPCVSLILSHELVVLGMCLCSSSNYNTPWYVILLLITSIFSSIFSSQISTRIFMSYSAIMYTWLDNECNRIILNYAVVQP